MDHVTVDNQSTLRARLQIVEDLEQEHSIIGVSVAVCPGEVLLTENLVDSVIGAIERGSGLLKVFAGN